MKIIKAKSLERKTAIAVITRKIREEKTKKVYTRRHKKTKKFLNSIIARKKKFLKIKK